MAGLHNALSILHQSGSEAPATLRRHCPGVRDMPSVLATSYTERESDKNPFKNKCLSRYDVAGLLNMS